MASSVDELDLRIVHALRIDGRVPFSRIAEVLDVSTQTVARRFRRLSREVSLRVVGVVNPQRSSREKWILRLSTRPNSAQNVAENLARRGDTMWVRRMSGGQEICLVTVASTDEHQALLFRDIPRTSSITDVSAHRLLHTYLGGPTAWQGHRTALTSRQQEHLAQESDALGSVDKSGEVLAPDVADWEILLGLQRNGRMSFADLAAETGLSVSTVMRRIDALRLGGILSFDVEIGAEVYGITTQALLWMSVAPAHLNQVARTLMRQNEIAFLASTTGTSNLVALALCRTPNDLHEYLANGLSSLDIIHTVETSPVQETLKTCSPMLRAFPGQR
ncbi:Lrp/AsnC family transcriptional regulator [Paenarthrobacter sp. NPDC090522]|uniref:Lrp/AsnC family transcriptional regulator n=1 Tax=Paenarthrobacter sp. NPDC090522 TaxID=3364383 RepID=UPI00380FA478